MALIFYNWGGENVAKYSQTFLTHLRQSSAAGEFAASALAMEVTPRPTMLYIDCTAVVHRWHLRLEETANAGAMLSSYDGKKRPNIKEVRFIKIAPTRVQRRL